MEFELYREISHTADVAYEFEFADFSELLRDIIEVVKENVELIEPSDQDFERTIFGYGKDSDAYGTRSSAREPKRPSGKNKCFEVPEGGLNEDFLFDLVNDIIALVDKGWYPEKTSGNCIQFIARPLVCKIKALTYHGLHVSKVGEKFITRMVFDR